MLENLTYLAVVQIFAGLGFITIFLAYLKRYAERSRWDRYKVLVDDWMEDLRESEEVHPNDLTDLDWRVRCERLLTDAKFSPLEIHQVFNTAIIVAKGIAHEKFFL